MSYLVTDFNKIRQEKSILEILEALERGFVKFGIDYYVIGAVAREVWMRGLKDITPRRATSDIDFGILIKNSGQFAELKDYLIGKEGFVGYKENAFVLIAPDKRQIDILPFGEIEKEGKVTVQGTGMTTLYVDGMKEVFAEGVPEVSFEEKITFKVCTLPGIVLLKLIAYDDRPEVRRDDLVDIADILLHFFSIYDELIWNEHHDLFGDERALEEISARVLGREMGKILKRNEKLTERVLAILSEHGRAKTITETVAATLDKPADEINEWLSEIKIGINEVAKQ
jgi:predicted nucleotidyltransferase